jgi:hypothetical protein
LHRRPAAACPYAGVSARRVSEEPKWAHV